MERRCVTRPTWYTGKTSCGTPNKGYVFEHIIVYCATHNITEVPKGFVIHHIDHNKNNNCPTNLVMMTGKEHKQHHYQCGDLFGVKV